MAETSTDVIKRYLEDAIASEKSLEAQLEGFATEGDNQAAEAAFRRHAAETRNHWEQLTARLEALGGSVSGVKNFLAEVFGLSPKTAQVSHENEDRATQNLIIAFALENNQIAVYELLATMAESAGDSETESLARQIQAEEKRSAENIWTLIPAAAVQAFERVTGRSRIESAGPSGY
ncbi:MAG: DUF892 family protein [Bryobacteraceae bacterium]